MRRLSVARAVLFAALPFLVYFALQHFEPRSVGVILLVVLFVRAPRRILAALRKRGWPLALTVLLASSLLAALWWRNDAAWVMSYPVLINAGLFCAFGLSLLRPPTVVERFARLRQAYLPPAAVAYTRRVTQLWCVFFVVNGSIAAWTAFAASRETWVLYNGLIAYVLMGVLFAGEWGYRRRRYGAEACR